MAASFNKVIIMGNVTQDPQVRPLSSGQQVCTLRLAVNRQYKAADGMRDEACFIDVNVWGAQAQASATYLRKGSPVFVEGFLREEQWTDKATGAKRSRHSVTAERVQFLSSPSRNGGGFAEDEDRDFGAPPESYNDGPAPAAESSRFERPQASFQAAPAARFDRAPAPAAMPPPPSFSSEAAEDDIPF